MSVKQRGNELCELIDIIMNSLCTKELSSKGRSFLIKLKTEIQNGSYNQHRTG